MANDPIGPFDGKLKKFLPEIELDLSDIENQDMFYGRTKLLISLDRFLGLYEEKEVHEFLHESGILPRLKEKGYSKVKIEIITENIRDQRLNIRDKKSGEIIVIMRLHLGSFVTRDISLNTDTLDLLFIDYLGLSDIKRAGVRKSLYPGQNYPGLGIFPEVEKFIDLLSKRRKLDGIANIPEYYHDAVLFKNHFQFIIPSSQGIFENLHEFGKKNGLKKTSLSIQKEGIYKESESGIEDPFRFRLGEMVAPNCTELRYYFQSDYYLSIKEKVKKSTRFFWKSE